MKPVKNSSRQQNKDCLRLDPALTAFCTYSYRIKCKYLEIAQCIYTAVFHRFSDLGIFYIILCVSRLPQPCQPWLSSQRASGQSRRWPLWASLRVPAVLGPGSPSREAPAMSQSWPGHPHRIQVSPKLACISSILFSHWLRTRHAVTWPISWTAQTNSCPRLQLIVNMLHFIYLMHLNPLSCEKEVSFFTCRTSHASALTYHDPFLQHFVVPKPCQHQSLCATPATSPSPWQQHHHAQRCNDKL